MLFILVLCKCICNAPMISLFLPISHDTISLGSPPPHQVVYPLGSITRPRVTASHFLERNRETELKLNFIFTLTFLCFPFFSYTHASIAWVVMDGFTLCPDPFFLRSFLLVSYLGIVMCQPHSGIRYISNKYIYIYIYIQFYSFENKYN